MTKPGTPLLTIPGEKPVTIIIPTFNNPKDLMFCLFSILTNTSPQLIPYRVIVINNGEETLIERSIELNPWIQKALADNETCSVDIIEAKGNLGWEGGLKLGLEHTKSPVVMFLNDDTTVYPGNEMWLYQLHSVLRVHTDVAAVGPASDVVMGAQNFYSVPLEPRPYTTGMLIGFCLMVRRDALDDIGGVPQNLPGGDDLDMSIKFSEAGWRLVAHRGVFVHHHGFKTGERIHGKYWNSPQMTDLTKHELIRRNGLKAYVRMMTYTVKELEPNEKTVR